MKKIIIASTSALLAVGSLLAVPGIVSDPAAAISENENSKISAELAAELETSLSSEHSVIIFIKNKTYSDVMQERIYEKLGLNDPEEYEKFYALSEREKTDLEKKARLEVINELQEERFSALIERVGIPRESITRMSYYGDLICCTITGEQILRAAEDEEVSEIVVPTMDPTDIPTEPITDSLPGTGSSKCTKEDFLKMVISEDEDFSNGGFIYRGDLKFDAVPNGDIYNLIVYGIKKEDIIPGVGFSETAVKMNSDLYSFDGLDSVYSGCASAVTPTEKVPYDLFRFPVVFYVENVQPGDVPFADIVETSFNYVIDITRYIYTDITPADVNNDGAINASDASLILKAYAYTQTGKTGALNSELFDCNGDGKIDSSDASMVLAYYSKSVTTNDPVDWDTFKKENIK